MTGFYMMESLVVNELMHPSHRQSHVHEIEELKITSTTAVDPWHLKIKDRKEDWWPNQKILHHYQHAKGEFCRFYSFS